MFDSKLLLFVRGLSQKNFPFGHVIIGQEHQLRVATQNRVSRTASLTLLKTTELINMIILKGLSDYIEDQKYLVSTSLWKRLAEKHIKGVLR